MNDKNFLDILCDENNSENIILYDAENNPMEFEQIAFIPLDGKFYAIMKPVIPLEGMNDDEAWVFEIDEYDSLEIKIDEEIIDRVFEEYYKLLEKADDDED